MSYKLGRELYRTYGTHLMQCKYSTCSQLGLMVSACGCLCFTSALYQLVNHDSFKALLFLSLYMASIAHSMSETTCEWRVQELIYKQCRKHFNFKSGGSTYSA